MFVLLQDSWRQRRDHSALKDTWLNESADATDSGAVEAIVARGYDSPELYCADTFIRTTKVGEDGQSKENH
jgi:hypothetical protein